MDNWETQQDLLSNKNPLFHNTEQARWQTWRLGDWKGWQKSLSNKNPLVHNAKQAGWQTQRLGDWERWQVSSTGNINSFVDNNTGQVWSSMCMLDHWDGSFTVLSLALGLAGLFLCVVLLWNETACHPSLWEQDFCSPCVYSMVITWDCLCLTSDALIHLPPPTFPFPRKYQGLHCWETARLVSFWTLIEWLHFQCLGIPQPASSARRLVWRQGAAISEGQSQADSGAGGCGSDRLPHLWFAGSAHPQPGDPRWGWWLCSVLYNEIVWSVKGKQHVGKWGKPWKT